MPVKLSAIVFLPVKLFHFWDKVLQLWKRGGEEGTLRRMVKGGREQPHTK